MALWSNTDVAGSAPKSTVDVTNGNTGVEAFELTPVGTFGVTTANVASTAGTTHSGWVLKTVGSGGRAGRTTSETLVATGSIV